MKQNFDKNIHEKFKSYFEIKDSPSDIEKLFYNKTEKYLKYIKWIPGLKMIWIWNSISMNSANAESDIDLLIVTTPNSLWLNRIIITFIFQILGVRKNDKYHAGRFCLSFFATTTWLDFNNWKIENDVYLYFWIVYFKPILSYNNTYELFIEKNNSWADFSDYIYMIEDNKKYIKYQIPLSQPFPPREKGVGQIVASSLPWGEIEKGIWGLNNLFKKIFLPKTLNHFNKIWKPYWVIINDNLLKFHNWDIRKKIKEDIIW